MNETNNIALVTVLVIRLYLLTYSTVHWS